MTGWQKCTFMHPSQQCHVLIITQSVCSHACNYVKVCHACLFAALAAVSFRALRQPGGTAGGSWMCLTAGRQQHHASSCCSSCLTGLACTCGWCGHHAAGKIRATHSTWKTPFAPHQHATLWLSVKVKKCIALKPCTYRMMIAHASKAHVITCHGFSFILKVLPVQAILAAAMYRGLAGCSPGSHSTSMQGSAIQLESFEHSARWCPHYNPS